MNTLSKVSDNQSCYSQPPSSKQYNAERYNIFNEDAKLKRLALMSNSSNKKSKKLSTKSSTSPLIKVDHLSFD